MRNLFYEKLFTLLPFCCSTLALDLTLTQTAEQWRVYMREAMLSSVSLHTATDTHLRTRGHLSLKVVSKSRELQCVCVCPKRKYIHADSFFFV